MMSAEDLFYAQMNGEVVDNNVSSHSHSTMSSSSMISVEETRIARRTSQTRKGARKDRHAQYVQDAAAEDLSDSCSFAGLSLPDDETPAAALAAAAVSARRLQRRNSAEGGSSISNSISKASKRTEESCHSRSSIGDDSDNLMSIGEIQRLMLKTMPEHVKNKIPEEAMIQIYGSNKDVVDASNNNKDPPSNVQQVITTKAEEDDSSVVSEMIEFAGEIGTSKKSLALAAPLAPGEENLRDEDELCPALPGQACLSSSRHITGGDSCETQSSYQEDDHQRLASSNVAPASPKNKTTNKKSICFGYVQVRHYQRILDINPSVSNGAAVGIGWRYKKSHKISVDEWEWQRGHHGRNSNTNLIMPRQAREDLLQELGYSQTDIAQATRIILKIKNQRKTTVQNLGVQATEEAVESASRKVRGLLSSGRKKGLV